MSAPCATCRHNAGDHCTREALGLTPYWWRWGGRLIEGCKPGRPGHEVCPRYERRPMRALIDGLMSMRSLIGARIERRGRMEG